MCFTVCNSTGPTGVWWHPLPTPTKDGAECCSILLETALTLWWLACPLTLSLKCCRVMTALGQLATRWRSLQDLPHASVLKKHCILQDLVRTVHGSCCSLPCRTGLSGTTEPSLAPLSCPPTVHSMPHAQLSRGISTTVVAKLSGPKNKTNLLYFLVFSPCLESVLDYYLLSFFHPVFWQTTCLFFHTYSLPFQKHSSQCHVVSWILAFISGYVLCRGQEPGTNHELLS